MNLLKIASYVIPTTYGSIIFIVSIAYPNSDFSWISTIANPGAAVVMTSTFGLFYEFYMHNTFADEILIAGAILSNVVFWIPVMHIVNKIIEKRKLGQSKH